MTSAYRPTPGTARRIHVGQGGIPFYVEVATEADPLGGVATATTRKVKFLSPSGASRSVDADAVAAGAGEVKAIDDDRGVAQSYFAQLSVTIVGDEESPAEFFHEAGIWTVWAEVTPQGASYPLVGTATEFEVFAAGAA